MLSLDTAASAISVWTKEWDIRSWWPSGICHVHSSPTGGQIASVSTLNKQQPLNWGFPRRGPVLTSPGSGCAGPTLRCCRHCSMRSRPWSRGWWPEHSRQGLRMSALPWCVELELPGPRWTVCWLPLQQLRCDHQGAICRNGCSYPCSVETKAIMRLLMRKRKQH